MTSYDLDTAIKHLRKQDPVLGELIQRVGPYEMREGRNAFEVMLRTIVSQQLSGKAAESIYGRLATAMGSRSPKPEHLLVLNEEQLRACGLSRSKAAYVRNVAEHFGENRYTLRSFDKLEDEAVIDALTSIKGVGEWSAHIFLMFALRRADVFPIGDLGLRKGMMKTYKLRKNTKPARFHKIAEAWRPYRTVGSLYMWRNYDNE
jgi:DNA-3-methyladenine glycosylase II